MECTHYSNLCRLIISCHLRDRRRRLHLCLDVAAVEQGEQWRNTTRLGNLRLNRGVILCQLGQRSSSRRLSLAIRQQAEQWGHRSGGVDYRLALDTIVRGSIG